MGRRKSAVVAVLALALAAPAAASGKSSIAVENGAIRFVGDGLGNQLDVYKVENGEQSIYAVDVTLGPGCRTRPPDSNPGPLTGLQGNILCTRTGVDRFEVVGGGGNDKFTTSRTIDVPVHADMGEGDDRFDFGSSAVDVVQLGPGRDDYFDDAGNDFVDGGSGDDRVYGSTFSTGNDVITGGEGDDTLDGLAGNDMVDGGPGDDVLLSNEGDDTLLGGDDDDVIGGDVEGCAYDVGDDTMSGGPGNDQLCGGPGLDTLDGGDGNDALNAVDSSTDGPIACGAGADAAWADASDTVAVDCELQDNRRTVTLPAPGVVPVALPCQKGACRGELSLFATPDAASPDPAKPPPLSSARRAGKALAKGKFKLSKTARRSIRVRLSKAATKRLRKLGKTTVQARVAFVQRGKRHVVRRTFRVRPR